MIRAGIIGFPIEQSKSPLIHRYWLEKYGMLGSYERFSVHPDDVQTKISELVDEGFAGINATVPHKLRVLEIADEITPTAKTIGAANTLRFLDGKIIADNTDAYGFIASLHENSKDWWADAGPALVLGAGGAARAIIHALKDDGAPKILIANRTRSRADELADEFGCDTIEWNDIPKYLENINTFVNTTSLGMIGQPDLDVDITSLPKTAMVSDIVYNPLETTLIKKAHELELAAVNGLGMLLHQAVPGFEYWFGPKPDVDAELYLRIEQSL